MEDGEESNLWEVGPDEKVDEHEDGKQEAGNQATAEKRVEERMRNEVVDALESQRNASEVRDEQTLKG